MKKRKLRISEIPQEVWDYLNTPRNLRPKTGKKYSMAKLSIKSKTATPQQLKEEKKKIGKIVIVDAEKKKSLVSHLWKKEHLVVHRDSEKHSQRRRYIEALAHHYMGDSLENAARAYGIVPESLALFRNKFLKADSAIPQYLEELFNLSALDALGIFHQKKEDLTAFQAGMLAQRFAESAVNMKKARASNYTEDTLSLTGLQKLDSVLNKIKLLKEEGMNIIDTAVEIKKLPENAED